VTFAGAADCETAVSGLVDGLCANKGVCVMFERADGLLHKAIKSLNPADRIARRKRRATTG
jgi:hypothetical protein